MKKVERNEIELPDWHVCLDPPARHKALFGGRASAKSRTVATKLVLKLASAPEPGLRWLCARETQKALAASSKQEIEDAIERHGFSTFFRRTDTDITGANGSVFLFEGLQEAERIKSTARLAGAWVEEAQTVSRRSIELLVPTVREPGSEIWWTWNPRYPTDPVDEMFRTEGEVPEDWVVRQVSYFENPWFPQALQSDLERDRRRDPEKFRHVWMGAYETRSEATVFPNCRIEPFETPDEARLYLGADWGFRDPTVLLRAFIGRWVDGHAVADAAAGDTIFIDHEAYQTDCQNEQLPALFDRVPESRKWPIIADSARPELIDFMQRQGFRIRATAKGADSIERGVSFLRNFDIVIHPRCEKAALEFSLYRFQTDRHTGDVLPKLQKGGDHTIDACRYAFEGQRPQKYSLDNWIGIPRDQLRTGATQSFLGAMADTSIRSMSMWNR